MDLTFYTRQAMNAFFVQVATDRCLRFILYLCLLFLLFPLGGGLSLDVINLLEKAKSHIVCVEVATDSCLRFSLWLIWL